MKSKCCYCKNRHTWDCDDGTPYPKNGCENFHIDGDTIPEKYVDKILAFCMTLEDINSENDESNWYTLC